MIRVFTCPLATQNTTRRHNSVMNGATVVHDRRVYACPKQLPQTHIARSVAGSLAHVLARLLARSLAGSLAHVLARSLAGSLAHVLAHLLARSRVRSLTCSLARSRARSLTCSLACSLARSRVRSLTRSLARGLAPPPIILKKHSASGRPLLF